LISDVNVIQRSQDWRSKPGIDRAALWERSGPRYAEVARCTQEMPEGVRECHKITKFSPALEP
jgi:hypothetical protein